METIIEAPPALYGTAGWGFVWGGNDINFASEVHITGRFILSSVWVTNVIQFGSSPVDNVVLSIYLGGTNPQNGTLLTTVSVPASGVPIDNGMSSVAQYTVFDLSVPIIISTGTYYFTLTRTGLYNPATGYYSIKYGTTTNSITRWSSSTGTWIEDTSLSTGIILYNSVPNLYIQTVQMVGTETGEIQTLNVGKDDDGTQIYYELETQELEFGDRAHLKNISDQLTVVTRNGLDGSLEAREDDGDYKEIPVDLSKEVSIGKDIDLSGHYLTFKWSGTSKESSPILEEIHIDNIEDKGITNG